MLKGIKNTLAVIGGITVASAIYKGIKSLKESGITMKDLKKQGEHLAESMDDFVEKKKEEKKAAEQKSAEEKNKEEVKEEVVSEEGNKEEENNQG